MCVRGIHVAEAEEARVHPCDAMGTAIRWLIQRTWTVATDNSNVRLDYR